MIEKIKIAVSFLLVVAGGAGFYLLSGQLTVFRWLAVIAGVVAGLSFFCKTTEPGARLITFFRETWGEVRKIVWPDRKETFQMTGLVFAFAVIMAIFLFLTDKTLEWVMHNLILGWK
ncbi:MAG: preprotein translocase subunit SecE [Zoogloeaceae bacterium]|jgi:preprotein translocase subunit SecE|nr:preprotein translocase subunit SecE [Zoogloeaceae bacterium]